MNVISFVKDYYYYLVAGAGFLIALILLVLLLTKRLNLKHLIRLISMIPAFVVSAEQVFPSGFGENKKKIVNSLVNQLATELNLTKYLKYIDLDLIIEDVLTAPQKKGVGEDAKKENGAQT